VERGHEVAVLHRGEHEAELPASVRHFHGKADDEGLLRMVASEFRPDSILHMMVLNPSHVEVIAATFTSLEKFVIVSSGDVYDAFAAIQEGRVSTHPAPISEGAPLRTGGYPAYYPADYDKLAAERAALAAQKAGRLPSVILRYPGVYGPGPVREWYWVKRIHDGRRQIALPGGGLGIFHRGATRNLAHATALALERAKPGTVYNTGDQRQYTVRQLTDLIATVAAHQWEVVPVPNGSWEAGTPYTTGDNIFLYDQSRIEAELGYTDVISPEEALRLTVEHLANNPPGSIAQIHPRAFDYEAEDAVIANYRGLAEDAGG
jgi:nucleoside-diphosphate-sugar epimerase